jgi:hypothetical protein
VLRFLVLAEEKAEATEAVQVALVKMQQQPTVQEAEADITLVVKVAAVLFGLGTLSDGTLCRNGRK